MQTSSRFLAFVALGGALTLVACGGSSVTSPVAPEPPATSQSDDGGPVTSDGYGPGTGTCTNDCDGTGQGPGPGNGTGSGYGPGPGPSDGFCGNACAGPVGPDPGDIAAILELALQEEYGAEMLYRHVLAIFGPDTAPFALIAEAEARHVEALKLLFTRRNLAPPPWAPVSFPAFATIPEACAAASRPKWRTRRSTRRTSPHRPAPGRPERLHEPAGRLAREPPPGLRALPVGEA